MGYDISGFIARRGYFAQYRQLNDRVTVAPLQQYFELTLYDRYLEKVIGIADNSGTAAGYESSLLSQAMVDQVMQWSQQTAIAYIEAHFSGGNGPQFAVLWKDGNVAVKPSTNGVMLGHAYQAVVTRERPINKVLRVLGVQVFKSHDEFEAVGLMQYRHNEDWFAAFTSYSVNDYTPYED